MNDREIQQLKDEIGRLRKLVFYDELTGLLNRRGFSEEAGRIYHSLYFRRDEHERRATVDIPFSVIFLDIDDFKKVNDKFGHTAGDTALKAVADVIKKTVRGHDIVGRLGGEELVVALSGASMETTLHVGERIRADVENIRLADFPDLHMTASVGIAERKGEHSLEELIQMADTAMYKAKTSGKNKVIIL